MNVSEGNITTGQLVSRLIRSKGGSVVGLVGYFYGEVNSYADQVVCQIDGYYRTADGYAVNATTASGREVVTAPNAKFAVYVDQVDAYSAFQQLRRDYRTAVAAGDYAAAEALKTR